MHLMAWALTFARASAGRSNPARMAMMAMTTRSSMSVNATLYLGGIRQDYCNGTLCSTNKTDCEPLQFGWRGSKHFLASAAATTPNGKLTPCQSSAFCKASRLLNARLIRDEIEVIGGRQTDMKRRR